MKILVHDEEHDLRIVIPTALIFSRATAWLVNHFGRKYAEDAMSRISPEALKLLFVEFRRIKKKHGSWELVDVESSDGEKVKIIL